MKTTKEFFCLTVEELLELDELGGTIEENLLFGHGENVTYFDSLKEYEHERKEFEQWLNKHNYKVKDVFETINERLAFVLIQK